MLKGSFRLCRIAQFAESHSVQNSTLCRIPHCAEYHIVQNNTLCCSGSGRLTRWHLNLQ
jgi:hypothetical protein